MRILLVAVAAVLLTPAIAGADVLATVDDATLTWDDVLMMIGGAENVPYLGLTGEAAAEEILLSWVREEIMVRAAEDAGVAANPEVAFLIDQARRQILLEAFMSEQVAGQQPSQLEVENYAQEWMDTYRYTANVRHIVVDDPNLANAILAQVRGGGDFATLAQQNSIGPSSIEGGDLGWITRGQSGYLAFDEAVFTLEVGEISDVVETGAGYHIIEVLDIEPLDPEPTLAEVTEFVAGELTQAMQEEIILSLVDDLMQNHSVELYPGRMLQHTQ